MNSCGPVSQLWQLPTPGWFCLIYSPSLCWSKSCSFTCKNFLYFLMLSPNHCHTQQQFFVLSNVDSEFRYPHFIEWVFFSSFSSNQYLKELHILNLVYRSLILFLLFDLLNCGIASFVIWYFPCSLFCCYSRNS